MKRHLVCIDQVAGDLVYVLRRYRPGVWVIDGEDYGLGFTRIQHETRLRPLNIELVRALMLGDRSILPALRGLGYRGRLTKKERALISQWAAWGIDAAG